MALSTLKLDHSCIARLTSRSCDVHRSLASETSSFSPWTTHFPQQTSGPSLVASPTPRKRNAVLARSGGGVGFGPPQGSKKGAKKGGKKDKKGHEGQSVSQEEIVSKAVKAVEADEKKQGGKFSANVNPQEAARGKVDFVQVEAWGKDPQNDQSEIEKLKIKSFSPAFTPADESGDFYEQLARRLALLETSGELRVASAKPIPDFTRWKFGVRRYLQYLVDLRCVHRVLESAIAAAAPACPAIRHFTSELGLDREAALAEDVAALIYTMKKKGQVAGPREGRLVPEPTTQTQAYAKYVHQLGGTATSLEAAEASAAQKKLLAHIFALHVTHLTSGMRIGSKALELLPLMREAQAVHFYRDYPEQALNPLKRFVTAVNSAGEALQGTEAREEVMAELPKALQKTSLLLMELAVIEDTKVSSTSPSLHDIVSELK